MDRILSGSPEELRKSFFALSEISDISRMLEIPHRRFFFFAFIANYSHHYKVFRIPKRSGGFRAIAAPSPSLKSIQRRLNEVLQAVYQAKATVHGFVPDRSILSNARRHNSGSARKRFVFNLDIADFFPSITYQRVLGMFKARPYELPDTIARAIARICCWNGSLPQGAPTSPVISNMICSRMDTELRRLAQQTKCVYTRYADDITFSTTLPTFPSPIAVIDPKTGQPVVGATLEQIIHRNGFVINQSKVRLQSQTRRQEVTGLTVNRFPNVPRRFVRQIRAMLHAWNHWGFDQAQNEYRKRYAKPGQSEVDFRQVVRGKIEYLGMVRGIHDSLYLKLRDELRRIDPDQPIRRSRTSLDHPVESPIHVMTEGASDWKLIKAALTKFHRNGQYLDLVIDFYEVDDVTKVGDSELENRLRSYQYAQLGLPHILVFDRDKHDVVERVVERGGDYKKWGRDLYSLALPVPPHRKELKAVCIEHYFTDPDLTRLDKNGRRLFLNTEFDKRSLRHKTLLGVSCADSNRVKRPELVIIDNDVYDNANVNIALPKNDFATYVLQNEPGFADLDMTAFGSLFDLMLRLRSQAKSS